MFKTFIMKAGPVVAIGVLAVPARAQVEPSSSDTTRQERVSNPYLAMGTARLDVSGMNRAFRAGGFPAVGKNIVVAGVGVTFWAGDAAVELFGGKIAGQQWSNANGRSSLDGDYLMINVAYAVISTPRLNLGPRGGVGYGRIESNVDVTRAPSEDVQVKNHSMLFQAGVGGEYVISPLTSKTRFSLGVRAGYFWNGQSAWSSDGRGFSVAPRAAWGGPYVQAVLAFTLPRKSGLPLLPNLD